MRELTSAQASQLQHVALEGVLTYVDLPRYLCFLQDGSGGIFLQLGGPASLQAGQRLRVLGTTGAGYFTPIVRASNVTVLDRVPLPVPRRVTFAEFKTGLVDSD